MKKNLLFICVLTVSTTVFSQSRMANLPDERVMNEVSHALPTGPVATPSSSSVAPAIIWEDDFSNSANWVFTNTSIPSLDWHILDCNFHLTPYFHEQDGGLH